MERENSGGHVAVSIALLIVGFSVNDKYKIYIMGKYMKR
jgi:hypothetical protein